MEKTTFQINKMDCPSEENLITMKLDGMSAVKNMDFDLPNRKLIIFHNGQINQIEQSLKELNLGTKRLTTEKTEQDNFIKSPNQKKILWYVLAINFAFFIIEMTTGLISGSMGLVADSLDMLADSLVYGISLFAVGSTLARKKKVATIAGYFQLILATIGFFEVLRRFIGDERLPDFSTMIIISFLALLANITCLYLLQKARSQEAHMQASMIFTSNDIIINSGVMVAGLLVNWLNSSLPDLIIGAIVFIIVIRGAIRILKLGR